MFFFEKLGFISKSDFSVDYNLCVFSFSVYCDFTLNVNDELTSQMIDMNILCFMQRFLKRMVSY